MDGERNNRQWQYEEEGVADEEAKEGAGEERSSTNNDSEASLSEAAANSEAAAPAVGEQVGTSTVTTTDEAPSAEELLLPDHLRGPLDPERLKLSEQQRQWALQVKDAVEGLPDLDSISDFMCAHLALVHQGNVAEAIDIAYRLEKYRQNYDILDTFDQGKRVLSRFLLEKVPGYILNFFYCKAQNRYVLVVDFTKMNPGAFANYEDRNTLFIAGYYLNHAMHLDLMAIERGVILTVEWEGFIARAPQMVSFKFFRHMNQDVADCYPTHVYEMQQFNTGLFVNMMLSMFKRYLPPRLGDKFVLGLKSDCRLDTLCLVPNREAALARIEREIIEALRRRYEADRTFRL